MQWLKRLSMLGLLLFLALAVPVGPALAEDLRFASGSGRVRPSDEFTWFAFTSFAFTAVRQPDGSSTGVAVFRGRLESLTVAIDCLRTGIDIALDDIFVYRTFAIASGTIMDVTNNMALIGKSVIFGAIDGDKTLPTPEKDTIDGDFSGLLPSYVTCENGTLAVLHRVVGGEIIISDP